MIALRLDGVGLERALDGPEDGEDGDETLGGELDEGLKTFQRDRVQAGELIK